MSTDMVKRLKRLKLIRDEADKLLPDGYEAKLVSSECLNQKVSLIVILCRHGEDNYVLDYHLGGRYEITDGRNTLVDGKYLDDVLFRFTTRHRMGAL